MCKSKNWRRILSRPAGAGAGSGEGSRPSYQLALVLPLVAAGTADDADIVEPMISMMVMLPDSTFKVPTMMIVELLALGGA